MSTLIETAYARLLAEGEEKIKTTLKLTIRRREKQGQELVCDCPVCGKEAHLYVSTVKPVAHCFVCNFGGDWIDLLMRANGWTFRQAREYILKEAGLEVEAEADPEEERRHRRQMMLYYAHEYFKSALFREEGRKVLEYLVNVRKYSENLIREMELGAYASREGLADFLKEKGFTEEEMAMLIADRRLGRTHTLAIPWQDASGRVVGFSFRAIEDIEPKYVNISGFKKSEAVVGIDKARFWCRQDDKAIVLVCEGVLDALHWNAKTEGKYVAIAVGGTEISPEQMRIINSLDATLCLAFDNDGAGLKATEKIGQTLANRVDVFVAEFPEGIKDLDELLVEDKTSELRLVPLQNWLVRRIAGKYKETEIGKMRAIKECVGIASYLTGIAKEKFVEEMVAVFGYKREAIEEEIEKRDIRQLRRIVRGIVSKLKTVKDIEEACGVLEEGLKSLKPKAYEIRPYTSRDYITAIQSVPGGYETGFKALDNLVRIRPGHVTVVAGRPRHGKTSLLLNFLVRMIEKYPDKAFYFFSYELSREWITTMILMNLAGKVLDEQHNIDKYIEYFKTVDVRETGDDDIDEALGKFEEWTSEGRLYIIDEPFPIEDLAVVLSNLESSSVVFVDYVQKIPTTTMTNTLRYVEIQKVMEKIRETAVKTGLPIIVGAQTGRQAEGEEPQLHHLRESGDIEQDASVVIGIHNYKYDVRLREEAEKRKEKEYAEIKRRAELGLVKIIVLKNRFGATGDAFLKFDGRVYRFSENDKDD